MIRPEELSIKDIAENPVYFSAYDSGSISTEEAKYLRNALDTLAEKQFALNTDKSIYAAQIAATMRDFIFCSGKCLFSGRLVIAEDTAKNLLGFNFREIFAGTASCPLTAVAVEHNGRGIGSMMAAMQNAYLSDELGMDGYHATLNGGEVMLHKLGVTWRLDPPGNPNNRYWIQLA